MGTSAQTHPNLIFIKLSLRSFVYFFSQGFAQQGIYAPFRDLFRSRKGNAAWPGKTDPAKQNIPLSDSVFFRSWPRAKVQPV